MVTPDPRVVPPPDTREIDRLLRPQPPAVIPPRVRNPQPAPGLWARTLLGARVCK